MEKTETQEKLTDGEEAKEEQPADTSGEGIQLEAVSELDRADQIAERQKRENDRREQLIQREEALEARRTVGGQTEGGREPEKPKEESPTDYANRVMKGEANEPRKEE